MVKTRTSKVNPCGQCHLSTKDGVDCDRCKLWWCLDCLNKSVRGTCTPILYKKLCELGDFPFECEKCCRYLLPVQLVQADIYDEQHLIDKYNVNADAFKYRTDGSHGQPPTTATEPTEEIATATATASKLTPSVDEDFQAKLKLMQQGQIQLKEIQNQMQQQMKTQMQMFQEENQKMFQSMFKMQREEMQRMQEVLAKQEPQEAPTATTEMQVLAHTIATAISTATGTVTEDAARSRRQPSHLPKTHLPTFSGDVLQWEGFWESFNLNVHSNRDIDNRFKMDALRNLLNGAAYDKIAGLGITGEAYPEAIRVLESNYGNKQAQLEAARAAVSYIPAVKGDYGNLEKATDDFRTATSKLARMGVGNSALNEHANLFFCKLPMKLQLWIKEKRMDQGKWEQPLELPELLQLLQRAKLLHVKESQTREVKERETNSKKGKEGEPNSASDGPKLPIPTANFMIAVEDRVNGRDHRSSDLNESHRHLHQWEDQEPQQQQQRKQRRPDQLDRSGQLCAFCAWNRRNANHRSEECRGVRDVNNRWRLIKRAGLCFKCFKGGHSCSSCPVQGNCKDCKGLHHRALCRKGGNGSSQGSQLIFCGGETSDGRGRGSGRGAENLFIGKPNYKRPVKGHEAGRVNGRDVGYNYFNSRGDRELAGSAKGCAVGYRCKFKRPMGHGAGSVKGLDFGYYNCNSRPVLSHNKEDKSHWDEGSGESIKSATPTTGTGTTATTATVKEKKTIEIALTSEADLEKTQVEQTKANTATAEKEKRETEVTKKLVESTKTAPRKDVSQRKWEKKTNSGNLCQGHCLIHCLLLFLLLWKTSIQSKGGLNCRTFTSPSSDVNDGAPITPASFQGPGTQLGGLPLADDDRKDPDFLPASEKDVRREWKRLKSTVNQCRSIFQKPYLQELRETLVREFKKRKKGCDWVPSVGDTTLVMDHEVTIVVMLHERPGSWPGWSACCLGPTGPSASSRSACRLDRRLLGVSSTSAPWRPSRAGSSESPPSLQGTRRWSMGTASGSGRKSRLNEMQSSRLHGRYEPISEISGESRLQVDRPTRLNFGAAEDVDNRVIVRKYSLFGVLHN